jgi:sulfatase modifying factor 1
VTPSLVAYHAISYIPRYMNHGAVRPFTRIPWGRGLGLTAVGAFAWLLLGVPRASTERSKAPVIAPAAPASALTPALVAKAPPASTPEAPAEGSSPSIERPSAPVEMCPSEMVPIEGSYCTAVEQNCKRWLDDDLLPYARCAEYEPLTRCSGKRQALRFCIDRFEYTAPGQTLPQNYASFIEASRICESLGKRICTESEWNFACEGPDSVPYPYGFSRAPVCNQDLTDLYELNPKKQVLKDHRVPAGSMSGCRSPFGVYDMTGNLDEPVLREAQRYAYPFRNGLKGGWWMAGRNRCRPSTTAHDDHYRDIQIGIRCCSDGAARAAD